MNDLFGLAGKVALVTGASRGIGAACAQLLARAGAEVILNSHGEDAALDSIVGGITDRGDRAWSLHFDVADSSQIKTAFARVRQDSGGLDILVNNAGLRRDGLALTMSDEQWRQVLAVNLDGVFYCCREALNLMRKVGGSIVNIASVAAFTGSPGQANYAAAKGGVVALTRTLAQEYGSRGIRVNCVVPGFVDTAMTADLKPEYRERMLAQIPAGRFGAPAEVANAVLFLAGGAASYINGVSLHVNGGGYPA